MCCGERSLPGTMSEPVLNRVSVIVGGYGSGKTEVAINLSLYKRAKSDPDTSVELIDLDIVSPYFRSRDQLLQLKACGVAVVAPEGSLRSADLPALPAVVGGSILRRDNQVIIDVGGDPAGATALGRYSGDIKLEPVDVLMVINPYRPHTRTALDVLNLLNLIEQKSRLRTTAFVNNANLMGLTEIAHLERGQRLLGELYAQTGIPAGFISCMPSLVPRVNALWPQNAVLPLRLTMHPPWRDA
ncbi:MAG: hypothetical protein DDT20_01395 [Firmicutes bacterium]|nr:hypothetical protein [Bacillota bacterium]